MSTVVKCQEIICYLHQIMNKLLFSYLTPILFFFVLSCRSNKENPSEEHIKVVLREVGNQMLLINNDSTSLVLPIISKGESTFKLSFQSHLSFEPNDLVTVIRDNFKKTRLSEDYIVEVFQCKDSEVAYSYEVRSDEENTIIPCSSRILPNDCYTIEVKLINENKKGFNTTLLVIIALTVLVFIGVLFFNRRTAIAKRNLDKTAVKIGSFKFYASQNKLIKEAEEINLSKKECELLEIFVSRPNEVIKRDELTKRVWEDNGVFVGRSLDTYISKLRKKLKSDHSIKLTNIHGIGYKLELT